jgi:hypothetical protein
LSTHNHFQPPSWISMGKMINEGSREEHAESMVAEIIDKVKASGVDPCKKIELSPAHCKTLDYIP